MATFSTRDNAEFARNYFISWNHFLEDFPYPALTFDQKGTVFLVNQAALQLLRCRKEEVLGEYIHRFWEDKQLEHFTQERFDGLYEAKKAKVERRDGSLFYAEIRAKRALALPGCQFIATFNNITEKEVSREMLKRTIHELNQPLHAMTEVLPNLRRKVAQVEAERLNKKMAADCEGMQTCLTQAARLVRTAKDFFLLEQKQRQGVATVFKAAALLQEMERLFAPQAEAKGITMRTKPYGTDAPSHVKGDLEALEQALLQLLSNAIKFTPKDGMVTLTAEMTMSGQARVLKCTVSDSGPGIPENLIQHLFEAGPKRELEGQGIQLGLSLCKRYLEAAGGELGVHTPLNGGSEFWCTLPIETDRETPLSLEAIEETRNDLHRGLKCVFADDNAFNRKVMERMLTKIGYRPTIVAEGKAALDLLKTGEYDFAILDKDMQVCGMDGHVAAREWRQWEREQFPSEKEQLPIFALTGSTTDEEIEECLHYGMTRVLTKPANMEEIKAVVESCVLFSPNTGRKRKRFATR